MNSRWMPAWMGCFVIAALTLLLGCAGTPKANGDGNAADGKGDGTNAKPEPEVTDLFEKGDTVLFIGDDVTQQMFYTRAVATAMICMLPEYRLRFINGGRNGSTAVDAAKWSPDLLELCDPEVVVICFGFNDGRVDIKEEAKRVDRYRDGLEKLALQVKKYESVRHVILMTPPPVASARTSDGPPVGYNRVLGKMADATEAVARKHGYGYINVFEYLRQVYIAANTGETQPLTMGGQLPTEAAHIVMASVMLKAMAVKPQALAKVEWSPMSPRRMHQVRGVLALKLPVPTLVGAQRSRNLYEAMRRHDELFFRAWRLAGRQPSEKSKRELLVSAEQAWEQVLRAAALYFKSSASKGETGD